MLAATAAAVTLAGEGGQGRGAGERVVVAVAVAIAAAVALAVATGVGLGVGLGLGLVGAGVAGSGSGGGAVYEQGIQFVQNKRHVVCRGGHSSNVMGTKDPSTKLKTTDAPAWTFIKLSSKIWIGFPADYLGWFLVLGFSCFTGASPGRDGAKHSWGWDHPEIS